MYAFHLGWNLEIDGKIEFGLDFKWAKPPNSQDIAPQK